MTFTNAPIAEVLFTFAEFSGRSIIPGSEVEATISAEIRDQPWDVALRGDSRCSWLRGPGDRVGDHPGGEPGEP